MLRTVFFSEVLFFAAVLMTISSASNVFARSGDGIENRSEHNE